MIALITKLFSISLILVIAISPQFVQGVNPLLTTQVQASELEDELDRVKEELENIRNRKSGINNELQSNQARLNGLSSELADLSVRVEESQLAIAELELEIDELELSIEILTEQIANKERVITAKLEDIEDLEEVSLERLKAGYTDYRMTRPGQNSIFAVDDVNEYFKVSQHRQNLQRETQEILSDVVEQKRQLEYDREQLAEKKRQLARDKEVLDERRADLQEDQAQLEEEMDRYYSLYYGAQSEVQGLQAKLNQISEAESKKQAEAERLRQQILNDYNSVGDGEYVLQGQYIGRQGATGFATGPHVHFITVFNGSYRNPCDFVPAGKFGNCAGNGSLSWPLQGAYYFTSGYGWRNLGGRTSFHRAIDIAHSSWNAPVFAAHDGWVSRGRDQYGANYVILCENRNCNQGFKTGYWHLSSF